ncbi:hypothetical protein NQZ68_039554 [Dissostichus eleginoides]|nr:hypothetical protein NQZ68_039554 [Dissostichus eleginoides]
MQQCEIHADCRRLSDPLSTITDYPAQAELLIGQRGVTASTEACVEMEEILEPIPPNGERRSLRPTRSAPSRTRRGEVGARLGGRGRDRETPPAQHSR